MRVSPFSESCLLNFLILSSRIYPFMELPINLILLPDRATASYHRIAQQEHFPPSPMKPLLNRVFTDIRVFYILLRIR